jgi:predicted ATP-binding protein involved in virulence
MATNTKVIIKAKTKSSITEDIGELELGNITIFAGENNAGKTNLIKIIIEELKKQKINIINIPAERVLPDAEIKAGADKNPFNIAVAELLDVTFDDSKLIKSLIDDIEKILPEEFSRYNIEKMELSAKTKSIPNDDYIKAIKDVYIKKIIDSITLKDCYCNKESVELSEVGQGTQRLVIASLLKYLGDKKGSKFSSKLTYIIFEEPEIYLHPKLKESLFSSLCGIVENNKNIKIIITTHDPYFIDLGKEFIIYKVDRLGKNNSTHIKPIKEKELLDYNSSSEMNYLVFELSTPTYFIELYESERFKYVENIVKEEKELLYYQFDCYLRDILKIKQDEKDNKNRDITFLTKLRHYLAHQKSKDSIEYFNKNGKKGIAELRKYIESNKI